MISSEKTHFPLFHDRLNHLTVTFSSIQTNNAILLRLSIKNEVFRSI